MSITRRMFDARGQAIADTTRVYDDQDQPELSDRLHWITADDPPRFVAERIVVEMTDGTREIWTRGPEWCPLCDEHRDNVTCPHAASGRRADRDRRSAVSLNIGDRVEIVETGEVGELSDVRVGLERDPYHEGTDVRMRPRAGSERYGVRLHGRRFWFAPSEIVRVS